MASRRSAQRWQRRAAQPPRRRCVRVAAGGKFILLGVGHSFNSHLPLIRLPLGGAWDGYVTPVLDSDLPLNSYKVTGKLFL